MQKQHDKPSYTHPIDLPENFPFTIHDSTQSDAPIVSLHWHVGLEIGLCHEGDGTFMVESKVLPYTEGDVIVICAGQNHLARSRPGTVSRWTWVFCDPLKLLGTHFPLSEVPDVSVLLNPSFEHIFSSRRWPTINQTVRCIIEELTSAHPWREDVLRCHLFVLCTHLRRTVPGATHPDKDIPRPGSRLRSMDPVLPAVVHIHNHYSQEIAGEELARLCCMSNTNFRRVFKSAMQRSPKKYINDLRITSASIELRNTTRSIGVIASSVGFPTLSSFNRQFHAIMGISPRQWRLGTESRVHPQR